MRRELVVDMRPITNGNLLGTIIKSEYDTQKQEFGAKPKKIELETQNKSKPKLIQGSIAQTQKLKLA